MGFTVPQLQLSDKRRAELGKEFARRVDKARADRDQRMQEVWARAYRNYESKAKPQNWPWPNASNATLGLTASHTDAWASRLRNAGSAQDPTYLTTAWANVDLTPELTAEEYAELWQQASKWIEKEEIPNAAMVDKMTTILVKYGNVICYLPWAHDQRMQISYPPGSDEPIKTLEDILNKPVVHVLHPKNFYMDIAEEDVQLAEWCGFDEFWTEDDVRRFIHLGHWDKKAARAVLRFHAKQPPTEHKKAGAPFRRTEDGRPLASEDDFTSEQEKALEVPSSAFDSRKIPFVRVFARIDTDGDFIPEEVECCSTFPRGPSCGLSGSATSTGSGRWSTSPSSGGRGPGWALVSRRCSSMPRRSWTS